MEETLLELESIESNLDINKLPENISILKIEKTELGKGDYGYKKYDYSFYAFITINIADKKYIMCPSGYGSYGKNNDTVTGSEGVFEFKNDFKSIYDLQEII